MINKCDDSTDHTIKNIIKNNISENQYDNSDYQKNEISQKEPKKILIVDDEAFNRLSMHSIFEILGISDSKEICEEAVNGKQAFDIIQRDIH